jgi:serine/threonine protein kinase
VHDRFEAQSLDRWQETKPTTPFGTLEARREILNQLAKGLSFLHSCGSPHGRLQPQNVLVAADGGVRVIYGGLSAFAIHGGSRRAVSTESHRAFHASPYAAPEVAAGADASTAADSYSYGVIAYQLLAGTIPRGRFKPLALLTPGCPGGFSRCVDRCLEVTSSERPSAEQIIQAHGDATWGASSPVPLFASRFTDAIGRLLKSARLPRSQLPNEADGFGRAQGLAQSIAWEAVSFGLIGLLLGHLAGMALGTIAMACGFSAGVAIGIHTLLCAACSFASATAGLWREQCLAVMKSCALGQALIGVVTAAERYRDPQQKAADAVRRLEATITPEQMTLGDLRTTISTLDDAVSGLENTVLNASALPPMHAQLVEGRAKLLRVAAETAVAHRQYGVARELYTRLAKANPTDESLVARASQLTDLLERHLARISRLLNEGRLDDAAKRLQGLAKHFPDDDTLQRLLARYEEQRRLLHDAGRESLDALLRDNRWHRISEVVDALKLHSLPLGAFAKVSDKCAARQVVFARQREEAEAALAQVGPRRAAAWLTRLRATITDHPFITQFSSELTAVTAAQNHMREEVDRSIASGRWLAAENAVRSFLMKHEIGSASLVDAVQKMAPRVKAEWSRWRLLLWCLVAGAGFMAFAMLFSTASWHEASSAWAQRIPLPPQLQTLVGPGLVRGIQFLAAGVFLSVMLTLFGRRSVALVPIFLGLAIAVAVANALPPAWDALQHRSTQSVPAPLQALASALPTMVDTVCWLALFTAAAACVANVSSWTPSLAIALIAMVTLYGIRNSQVWANLLPEGFAAAAVLAIAGVIVSARNWFLISLAGAVASILATTTALSAYSDAIARAVPSAVSLFVTGVFVVGKRTIVDYAWLTIAVVFACMAGWFVRGCDSAELVRLFTVWMIACGGVAVGSHAALGDGVQLQDVSRAYFLRVLSGGSAIHGCPLVNSPWWKTNNSWHLANPQTGSGLSQATSTANQRHDEIGRR